jgi:hypothetical protein
MGAIAMARAARPPHPYKSRKKHEAFTPIGTPGEGGPFFPIQKDVLWMFRQPYYQNHLLTHLKPAELNLVVLVYVYLCELYNNNLNKPLSGHESDAGKVMVANITKSLITMTRARRERISWALQILRAMELIDYPDKRTRREGSWVVLYQFVNREYHNNRLLMKGAKLYLHSPSNPLFKYESKKKRRKLV